MNIEIFEQNIKWNFAQVAVQSKHADQVNGRAKSGYYKAAIIIAASVVEALAYKILSDAENRGVELPLENWWCKNSYLLPENYKGSGDCRLSICERRQSKFKLDKFTDFKRVNEICLKLKLFDKNFFNEIEKVRNLRNKIHIQGLEDLDRSYTKKELEFVSPIIVKLLNKL